MTLLARAFVLGFSGLRGHAWAWLAKLGAHSGHETCFNRCGASIRFGPEGTWVMAEGRRPWGKVRRLPSGRYQASYIIGSVRGVDPGTRYTALQTFDAKGDAWGWLDRERRLIDRGDWTPPIDRFTRGRGGAPAQAGRAGGRGGGAHDRGLWLAVPGAG